MEMKCVVCGKELENREEQLARKRDNFVSGNTIPMREIQLDPDEAQCINPECCKFMKIFKYLF